MWVRHRDKLNFRLAFRETGNIFALFYRLKNWTRILEECADVYGDVRVFSWSYNHSAQKSNYDGERLGDMLDSKYLEYVDAI